MDQDSQDEPVYLRHRSPTFSKDEIQTLVTLIAQHKSVINNKSYNNATLHAKEVVWSKITKIFNSQGYRHHRNVECLKNKWVNLKKDAKKVSKNLMDQHSDFDQLTSQIVSLVCEVDNSTSEISPKDLEDELIENQKESKEDPDSYWVHGADKEENKTDGTGLNKENSMFKRRMNRSMNFTPLECRLLLQCVRREKKIVFSKKNSNRALMLKQRAWARITQHFNKQSPHKRSTLTLRNKLRNMKKLAKQDGSNTPENNKRNDDEFTRFENDEDDYQNIKSEPDYDEMDRDDRDELNEDDMASDGERNGDNSFDSLRRTTQRAQVNLAPDPLSTILNGDSGFGSINMDPFNAENSEITKLKLELLKYQMETAKLERKRIEDAAQAESAANEARATEMALRLRAARLEAVAAAAKLPAHPALVYTSDEMRAQQYMEQYHPT